MSETIEIFIHEFTPFVWEVEHESIGDPITATVENALPEIPISITWITPDHKKVSIRIAGTFGDMFDRPMKYLDNNDVSHDITRFKQLPDSFHTLYQYRSASMTPLTFTIFVVVDGATTEYRFNVINDYDEANQMFVAAVRRGKF